MEDQEAKSSSGCQSTTVGDARVLVSLHCSVAGIAALACVVTALLIAAIGRAYRSYNHRLVLYLSVVSFLYVVFSSLPLLPLDISGKSNRTLALREGTGWNVSCVAFGFLDQYVNFANSLLALWICLYVFFLAVFDIKLKKPKHEVAGLMLTVLVGPALMSWEPFLHDMYGLSGMWCWMESDCGHGHKKLRTAVRIGTISSTIFLHALCLLLVVSIAVVLCARGLRWRAVLKQHWMALQEVLPLLIYPTVFGFASMLDLAGTIYSFTAKQHHSTSADSKTIMRTSTILGSSADLMHLFSVVLLPLSFLLNCRVWHRILHGNASSTVPWQQSPEEAASFNQTEPHTSQTSQTYYIASHEYYSSNERDPLVVVT